MNNLIGKAKNLIATLDCEPRNEDGEKNIQAAIGELNQAIEMKECDCLVYLAGFDYEGHYPVHKSEAGTIRGDEQIMFTFCPYCGEMIKDE